MPSNTASTKFAILSLLMLFLWHVPANAGSPRGSLRYSIVVDKFENSSGSHRALGDEWSTMLTSKLHESGQFIVIAQTDMQLNALKEQLRSASGVTVEGRKTAVRGQMAPAQLLVKGVITDFKEGASDQESGFGFGGFQVDLSRKTTEIRATMQMIDATTGALVAAKTFTGTAQGRAFGVKKREGGDSVKAGRDQNVHQAFEKAIDEVIPWMVAQLPGVPWRGSVVKVEKDRVIVNRGSREGVAEGDEFIVGESEILRDPDTGEVLDEVIRERARIKVVSVNERTAACSIVSGNIGQIVDRMAIRYARES